MKLTIIYVPCVSSEEALNISEELIKKGLVACVNIHESTSVYKWEGHVERQPEFIMVAKTQKEKLTDATMLIKEKHSYDVPAILTWEVKSHNKDYDDWVNQ